jgi:hypothetical protein
MNDRAIHLPGCGEGAACMTMPFDPIGTEFQQTLIGCGGFGVTPAIAENPGAQMGRFFGFRPKPEGDARAFDRGLTISPVQEGFAEPAIKEREFLLGDPSVRKITAACFQKAGTSAKLVGGHCPCTYFINVTHGAMLFEAPALVTESKT